ncbi:hypothetical protein CRG98_042509 [Punica granatum]|uniref:Uncharacterized protein n=1 Tax=Punica granatum TaxID=22663 RepID=A0A2I0HZD7_PUNGR|nr:hypothetical protein CRG98_042509 [Punica granatum]
MEWVASKSVPRLRAHPEMNGHNTYDFMMHTYRVKVSDATLYRAIKEAHRICGGAEKEQYGKLGDYCNELVKSNPRSTVRLNVAPVTHEFERMYVYLEACKTSFLAGCRPLIGQDFLKGYYRGQLLAVVAENGNNAFNFPRSTTQLLEVRSKLIITMAEGVKMYIMKKLARNVKMQMQVRNASGPDMLTLGPTMAPSAPMMLPSGPVMPPQVSNIPRQVPMERDNASGLVMATEMAGPSVQVYI